MDEYKQKQLEKEQDVFKTANIQDTTQIMAAPIQQQQDMQENMELNANEIQVEANLQQLEVEEDLELLSDAQREKAIEKAYEEHKKGTHLSALDKKGKRAKNMKKKAAYRKKAKAFQPPESENLGKLIYESGKIDSAQVDDEASRLETAIKQLKIKTDEAFANNLESNFEVLALLDQVKADFCKAVSTKAIQNLDSFRGEQIRTVIVMGEQVKKYMIAQQQLMQNPYYTMLAKKDVAGLSNEELEKKAKAVEATNPTLADYYRKVLEVRNSGFERAKGMDAAYANASKTVTENRDNVDELLETGKLAAEQYREEKKKKQKENKSILRAKKAEEAKRIREEKAKNAKFQERKKKFNDHYRPKYAKVEESNRELENADPQIAEYKILNSFDVLELIEKNPTNDVNTDEYQQIYARNFNKTGTRVDSAYIHTNNSSIINQYIRDRQAGIEAKRKEFQKDIQDEVVVQKKLEEWEEEIKDTIALLKQNAKHDSIPQKCRLYRMCGDYVLKKLGLDPAANFEDNKQLLVDQLNEKQGTVFKETNFSSTGYRADGDYFGVMNSPILLTILCEEGQKCFITANQSETEIIFDKPEFEIVKAELADKDHAKKVPLSSSSLKKTDYGIDYSSEKTAEFKGGIHLVVRLRRSDGDDPNA